jgi:hypothetical protein
MARAARPNQKRYLQLILTAFVGIKENIESFNAVE